MKETTGNLLEYLAHQAGFCYLSDLHHLDKVEKARLAQIAERLPVEEADRKEWNAALVYLTGAPLELTAQSARDRLIALLAPQKGGEG